MANAAWHLLGQREIYKQFNGMAKPKNESFIDDVIPDGILECVYMTLSAQKARLK